MLMLMLLMMLLILLLLAKFVKEVRRNVLLNNAAVDVRKLSDVSRGCG